MNYIFCSTGKGIYDDFIWIEQQGKNLAGSASVSKGGSLEDCKAACDAHVEEPCLSLDFFVNPFRCELHQENYFQAKWFFNHAAVGHYERNCSYLGSYL